MIVVAPNLARRRQLIRELLRDERIHSQEELRKRLRQAGVRAEQATLSRDLHALGVVKGPDGYLLPEAAVTPLPSRTELIQLLRQYLSTAEQTGPLVVLRTGPGRAQPVGLALDGARIPGVLGTIAGDDTIFVALRGEPTAVRFAKFCREIANGGEPTERDFESLGDATAALPRRAVRRARATRAAAPPLSPTHRPEAGHP